MAYDEGLEQRIREQIEELPNVVGKKMFGGICFMVQGNMACGVHQDSLIVRVGAEQHEAALAQSHTKVFDITGRPMKNWILVTPDGIQSDADLKRWLEQGIDFALSLPPK
jgi:TfoX/Sxy family transcriptional regulator of competence genes